MSPEEAKIKAANEVRSAVMMLNSTLEQAKFENLIVEFEVRSHRFAGSVVDRKFIEVSIATRV